MDDVDRWIHLDGPPPPRVRPLLDALRDAIRPSPEDRARVEHSFFERLDAMLLTGSLPAVNDEAGQAETPRLVGPTTRPTSRPPPAPAPVQQATEEGCTVRSPSFDDLPPPPPPEPPPPPAAPPPRPPAIAVTTAPMLELPPEVRETMSRLPFLRPEEVPPDKKAPRTLRVPLWRPRRGDTPAAGDDSVTRAVASLPFARRIPQLTLDAFASLCAEVTVGRWDVDAIRRAYHIDCAATHRALSEHWQRVFERRPEIKTAFLAKREEFIAYLRALPAAGAVRPEPGG